MQKKLMTKPNICSWEKPNKFVRINKWIRPYVNSASKRVFLTYRKQILSLASEFLLLTPLVCQAVGHIHNLLFYLAKCISGDVGTQSLPQIMTTLESVTWPLRACFFIGEKDGWTNKFEQINSHEAIVLMVSIVSADFQQATCCCKASGFLFFVAPSAGPAQRSRTRQCLRQTWWPIGDALHRWAPGQRELNAFCNHCRPRRPSQIWAV